MQAKKAASGFHGLARKLRMEVEGTRAAVDRMDVVGGIQRLSARAFVEDRGRAELPGESIELGDVGAEPPEQKRAVRLVEFDDLRWIDVEDAALPAASIKTWGRPGSGS
jgi:hypothetical protein